MIGVEICYTLKERRNGVHGFARFYKEEEAELRFFSPLKRRGMQLWVTRF